MSRFVLSLKEGDRVRIRSGRYHDEVGIVESIVPDQGNPSISGLVWVRLASRQVDGFRPERLEKIEEGQSPAVTFHSSGVLFQEGEEVMIITGRYRSQKGNVDMIVRMQTEAGPFEMIWVRLADGNVEGFKRSHLRKLQNTHPRIAH
jgi:transcription antitermination factor NusG